MSILFEVSLINFGIPKMSVLINAHLFSIFKEFIFFNILVCAIWELSTKVQKLAPLDKDSIPRAPEPAKISKIF